MDGTDDITIYTVTLTVLIKSQYTFRIADGSVESFGLRCAKGLLTEIDSFQQENVIHVPLHGRTFDINLVYCFYQVRSEVPVRPCPMKHYSYSGCDWLQSFTTSKCKV